MAKDEDASSQQHHKQFLQLGFTVVSALLSSPVSKYVDEDINNEAVVRTTSDRFSALMDNMDAPVDYVP